MAEAGEEEIVCLEHFFERPPNPKEKELVSQPLELEQSLLQLANDAEFIDY